MDISVLRSALQCHSRLSIDDFPDQHGRFDVYPISRPFLEKTPFLLYQRKLNRRFGVYSKEANLYQSESGSGSDGKESFKTAAR